jgi:DNA-binding NtrC family response regulator
MAKILIVEDELQWAILEEEALKKNGHDVVLAEASSTAWKFLEEATQKGSPFELVVIDIRRIPRQEGESWKNKEGLRLLKKIRSSHRYAEIPVICTTVWLMPDSNLPSWEDIARNAGANEFFEQPVDLDKFVCVVRELLEKCETGRMQS